MAGFQYDKKIFWALPNRIIEKINDQVANILSIFVLIFIEVLLIGDLVT